MLTEFLKFPHIRTNVLFMLFAVLTLYLSPMLTLFAFGLLMINNNSHKTQLLNDIPSVILVMSLLSFAYIGVTSNLVTLHNSIWYTVPSLFAFLIGKNICFKHNNQQYIYIWLFFMALFLAIPHIFVTFIDIFRTGLINPDRTLSLYDETTQRAVTARTVELSLAIAGIGFYWVKDEKNNLNKNTFIILSIFAELCTLHYVSRTGIFLFLLSFIIGMISFKRFSGKLLLTICIVIVLAFFLQDSVLFQLFADREQEGSNITDAGGRTERWALGLSMLLSNPLGYHIEDWYAHNFWLDFGRDGGLISTILLTIFSLCVLFQSFKIRTLKVVNKKLRFIILLYSLVFIATLFSEPVHSGARMYMYMYFMFSGMVVSINKIFKK